MDSIFDFDFELNTGQVCRKCRWDVKECHQVFSEENFHISLVISRSTMVGQTEMNWIDGQQKKTKWGIEQGE